MDDFDRFSPLPETGRPFSRMVNGSVPAWGLRYTNGNIGTADAGKRTDHQRKRDAALHPLEEGTRASIWQLQAAD
eukprot:5032078-Pleurochrysis_carterae.AAC.3